MSNVIQFVPKSTQANARAEAPRESVGPQQSAELHSIFRSKHIDQRDHETTKVYELAAALIDRAVELESEMTDVFIDIGEIARCLVEPRKVMDEIFDNDKYGDVIAGFVPLSADDARVLIEQFAIQIRVPPIQADNRPA
jgi:hypothetical protein